MNSTNRGWKWMGLAVVGVLALGATGVAQPPGFQPLKRPNLPSPVSPYLSLLGNNGAAFNYYEVYRPQRFAQKEIRQLNRQVNTLRTQESLLQQSTVLQTEDYQLGPTGHPTMFMNTRGYFGSR